MANAIRITMGLIMTFLALAFFFSILTFSIANQSQSPFGLDNALSALTVVGIPFVSAWLLLFPASKKQSYIGFTVALLYLGFIVIDQIL